MKNDFNNFRFAGLEYESASNKYFDIKNRISEDKEKCIVKVEPTNLIKTRFGYALILDRTRVQFLKDWQVSENFYGSFVLLTKKYWQPKSWGNHENFSEEDKYLVFNEWLAIAEEQDNSSYNDEGKKIAVKWAK